MSLAAPAAAQVQTEARAWSIPAGPLEEALTRFAQDSGLMLSYTASDLAGKRSAGLSATLSAPAALTALLSGTGLAAYLQPNGGYTVRHAGIAGAPGPDPAGSATQAATILPPVTVKAAADGGEITEGTGSYTTRAASAATRLSLSLRETPQSVSVITRQRMDDQALRTLDEVIAITPGLIVNKVGGATERSTYSARGFDISNILVDGMASSLSGYMESPANLAMYDRMEVVRGATGLTQGSGQPSAALNLVRKRPTHQFQGQVSASVARWNQLQGMVDLSSPLNASSSIRGRLVGSAQDRDSFRDTEFGRERLLYAITEIDLTPRTLLTVGGSSQDNRNRTAAGGLPSNWNGRALTLPRSTFLGYEWERWDKHTDAAFVDLSHTFDNEWKLKLAATGSWSRTDFKGTYTNLSGNTITKNLQALDYTYDQHGYEAYASGPFSAFGRRHELILGGGARQTTRDSLGGPVNLGTYPVSSFYTWNPSNRLEPLVNPTWKFGERVRQHNFYATTRLRLADPLTLILGARSDSYEHQDLHSSTNYKVSSHLTRYAGLVFDLDRQHSLYASYSDIFQPQSEQDIRGALLKPIVGANYEVGIKGDYMDGTLNMGAAVFMIDQENRAVRLTDQSSCPSYPAISCYEAAGLVRSKGVDLELQGAITPEWQMAVGYTYTEARYRRDGTASRIGQRLDTSQPRSQFKLSTSYRPAGLLSQWRLGGSLRWQNGTESRTGTFLSEQKAYGLTDLMVGYQANRQLDLQLNISNLFDKRYYRAIGSSVLYGEPRNITLTAKYMF